MYFNVAVQQSNAMSVAKDISNNEHKTKKDKQADTHTQGQLARQASSVPEQEWGQALWGW